MSAIYDLFETPSPNKGEKQPLHARIVSKGTVDKEEFLDRVHKFTGISRSLLAGTMEAFANEARDLLADGWNVEMGNFGFFSTSLQCPPVKDKKRNSCHVCPNEKHQFSCKPPVQKRSGRQNEVAAWRIPHTPQEKQYLPRDVSLPPQHIYGKSPVHQPD